MHDVHKRSKLIPVTFYYSWHSTFPTCSCRHACADSNRAHAAGRTGNWQAQTCCTMLWVAASSRSSAGLSASSADSRRCTSPGLIEPVSSRSYMRNATARRDRHAQGCLELARVSLLHTARIPFATREQPPSTLPSTEMKRRRTASLLVERRVGVEHGERAHKLAKVDDVVLLRVEHLKHAVREQVAALLRFEQRQRKLVLVDAAILRAEGAWLACWPAEQFTSLQYTEEMPQRGLRTWCSELLSFWKSSCRA